MQDLLLRYLCSTCKSNCSHRQSTWLLTCCTCVLWQGMHLKVSKWPMHTFRSCGHTFPFVRATCHLHVSSCRNAIVICCSLVGHPVAHLQPQLQHFGQSFANHLLGFLCKHSGHVPDSVPIIQICHLFSSPVGTWSVCLNSPRRPTSLAMQDPKCKVPFNERCYAALIKLHCSMNSLEHIDKAVGVLDTMNTAGKLPVG